MLSFLTRLQSHASVSCVLTSCHRVRHSQHHVQCDEHVACSSSHRWSAECKNLAQAQHGVLLVPCLICAPLPLLPMPNNAPPFPMTHGHIQDLHQEHVATGVEYLSTCSIRMQPLSVLHREVAARHTGLEPHGCVSFRYKRRAGAPASRCKGEGGAATGLWGALRQICGGQGGRVRELFHSQGPIVAVLA